MTLSRRMAAAILKNFANQPIAITVRQGST
jgi:hypothetical protein